MEFLGRESQEIASAWFARRVQRKDSRHKHRLDQTFSAFNKRCKREHLASYSYRGRECVNAVLGRFFFDEDFLPGTLAPAFRACDSPIAIACFLLVTFLPDLPLFSVPFSVHASPSQLFHPPSSRTWPLLMFLLQNGFEVA